MAGDLPLDVAHLLGFSAGMLLYGWYMCMLQGIFTELWSRRRRSRVVVWVTISLFLITTVNVALCITYEYNALIKYRVSPGVEAYYANPTWSTIKSIQYTLTFIAGTVADVLVCWRLYAIWNKSSRLVLFPAIVLAIDMGTFCSPLYEMFCHLIDSPIQPVIGFATSITSIATRSNSGGPKYATFTLIGEILNTAGTLLVNVYSTSLIIVRLWWISSRVQTPQGRSLRNSVIMSVIQSGALYTVTLSVYAGLSFTGHVGVCAFVMYILIVVIAISPLLIVTQLGRKFPSEPDGVDSSAARGEAVNGSKETSDARNIAFGAALNRRSKEISVPPSDRIVLYPSDAIEFKTFQASESPLPSCLAQTGSRRDQVDRRGVFVTVPRLPNSKDDVLLRFQKDVDIVAMRGSYGVAGGGCDKPLPSLEFAMDPE
ncbi:hypothetical protein FRB93_002487 [Tulasnella sp. JGI-2019a]|nr:hypothetical protein FRB93_002487 [Tulasnella sp. JGI-2019a]